MTNLISGKEAFNANMNGECVLWRYKENDWQEWEDFTAWSKAALTDHNYTFKIKPRTITINGIEVPAPFEPKDGENIFIPANFLAQGYMECKYPTFENHVFQFGVWRTEDEIKQVVGALRKVFNP